MITLDELFEMQSKVDSIIIEKLKESHKKKCEESKFYKLMNDEFDFSSTLDDRRIAFKVELGEFANETGFFKYWKESHVPNHVRIKDEWADCLAFLLSIIITTENIGFIKKKIDLNMFIPEGGYLPREYRELMDNPITYKIELSRAFSSLLWMGIGCGYTRDELFEGYMIKSRENIRRAKEGY